MKIRFTLVLLAITAALINLHAATSTLPAILPEFMDDAQTSKWSADQVAAQKTTSAASQSSTHFYTGKPYVADIGGYVFKYRTYNPEMARWTSADPSGFPDGVNNQEYVSNSPLTAFDADGRLLELYNKPIILLGIDTGYVHAYIYFDVYDCDGMEHTGTFSGEPQYNPPTLLHGYGYLQYVPNADVGSAQNNGQVIDSTSYGYYSDYCLYLDFSSAVASFSNTDFTYSPIYVSSSSYNSNGFAHGLLDFASIYDLGYSSSVAPNWDNPIGFSTDPQYNDGSCCCGQ